MAKEYFEKLSQLVEELKLEKEITQPIEIRHFFSGAAFYVNKTICASWSPAGMAFKLSDREINQLLLSGEAVPLKYFGKGHIKKGYALFENPSNKKAGYWKDYFIRAAREV
ncbi:MAG: hypothetical protein DWQ05_03715 [Calditrichaeota bacterium]|nr:MAG: hypothetical protein DWQ05_03715 [Calditrichota bacterium]